MFDTCVLRHGVPEVERFFKTAEIIKNRFKLNESVESLTRKRIFAHSFQYGPIASSIRKTPEPSDIDIYNHFIRLVPEFNTSKMSLQDSHSLASRLADCEAEMEVSVSQFSPLVAKIIEVVKPEKLLFVSDMYLSSHRILHILNALNPLKSSFDQGSLYVSNELNCSKSCGSLYDKVLSHSKILPSTVMHLGDNKHSDFLKAVENNIFAVHLGMPIDEVSSRRSRFSLVVESLNLPLGSLHVTL